MSGPRSVSIELPDWAWELCADAVGLSTPEERMNVVLELARRNIADGGGPFAAAIFDADGTMIAPGLNRVVAASAPIAHAEIVAIAMAGQRLGTWDLASGGAVELATTTEPCAMCLGAVPWSGVKRLVCSARDADARAIGFDEGHKPGDWPQLLVDGGIDVVTDVQRDGGIAVLQGYAEQGGDIYNGGDNAHA